MKIIATAPGHSKSIVDDGVGKLVCSGAKGDEAKVLQILFKILQRGDLEFWGMLMWAVQENYITSTEMNFLDKIINKVKADYLKWMGD
jgi:hypothetical protein